MIYTNDTVLSEVNEYRRSLWFFSLSFFFIPEFNIPLRGTLCDLWVSLTQPTRKGLVSEVRSVNPAAVFVFTPLGSLALSFFLATHDDVGKSAPSWSVVNKWSQLTHITT